jgi:hypothetical protein
MSAYVDPRFRPTLWPGTVLPIPALTPFGQVDVDGDWITWPIAPSTGQSPKQLPEDFYLRELMEVQPDDPAAAATLFRTYGLLFDLEGRELNTQNYDIDVRDEIDAIPRHNPEWEKWTSGVHRDLVRVHLETAQSAVETWLACQRENGLEELVEPWVTKETLADLQDQTSHAPSRFRTLDDVRELLIWTEVQELEDTLNAALSKYSVGIGDLSTRHPTVYSVAFLQLYNHLAEGASVRSCDNENCRRSFVRQRGRAEYGQHRTTGIKYCSRECARAQAQRALRRRRRAESNAGA